MPRISRSRRSLSPNALMARIRFPLLSAEVRPMIGSHVQLCQIKSACNCPMGKDFFGYLRTITQQFPPIRRLLISPNGAIIRPSSSSSQSMHKDPTFYMSEAAVPDGKPKRQLQEVAIFNDVAKALTSSLNLDSILQTIMDKMVCRDRKSTRLNSSHT